MMDFTNKNIIVNLVNGYVFSGTCIKDAEHSIEMIDKFGENVQLSRSAILSIVEGVR